MREDFSSPGPHSIPQEKRNITEEKRSTGVDDTLWNQNLRYFRTLSACLASSADKVKKWRSIITIRRNIAGNAQSPYLKSGFWVRKNRTFKFRSDIQASQELGVSEVRYAQNPAQLIDIELYPARLGLAFPRIKKGVQK